MNVKIGIAATTIVIALAAIVLLYPSIDTGTGFFTLWFEDQVYSIDSLSVFQSNNTTIGSGTPICTLVDVSGVSAVCDGTLTAGETYRFDWLFPIQGLKTVSQIISIFRMFMG